MPPCSRTKLRGLRILVKAMGVLSLKQKSDSRGFSVVELLAVIAVMLIIAAFAVVSLRGSQLYAADDQALIVLDFLKEARQRAITQREIMRVEINKDAGLIRLVNENGTASANDDVEIRRTTFSVVKGIVFDRAPLNITAAPVEPTPVPSLVYQASIHPSSTPDIVATLRFQPNGTVLNAGNTSTGANAAVTGATIYFWNPLKTSQGAATNNGEIIRAITVIGSSGNTRYLMCPLSGSTCPAWR